MDEGNEGKKVTVAHLDGTLLRDTSFFPYYMLMALEAGGPFRALLLLFLYPITWGIARFLSEALAIEINTFIATAGIKLSEVRAVAKAVLPKFYLDDLQPAAYQAFIESASSRRCAITSHPKVFVEYFLRTHLLVDAVLATDILTTKSGICTGFVAKSGVLHEDKKAEAVKLFFGDTPPQYCGIYLSGRPHRFLSELTSETMIVQKSKKRETVPREEYVSSLIFHDGRLVLRPTPFVSLAIFLWIPFGFILAIMRVMLGLCVPQEVGYPVSSLLGVKIRVKGAPPLQLDHQSSSGDTLVCKLIKGTIFVCTHRTLADPTFMALALRRKVRALAFSVSKISEFLTPIHLTTLTRNREEDRKIIDNLLEQEDLCICPEGTTCREPFLLRFSPLFAELGDHVVPVAVNVKTSIFHSTTTRGYKIFDALFLCMNPRPSYEIHFLEPVSVSQMRASRMSAIEIANTVQKLLADALGFQCTNYNRKDKYMFLAGNDGNVQ